MTKKTKKQVNLKNNSAKKTQDNSNVKLEKDLEEAKKQVEELTNTCKRAVADLQNFKRRSEEEQKNLVAFANSNLILEILPIVDNFERAIEHQPENVAKEWLDGVLQIHEQFKKMLQKQGVEEIKSVGEECNPNYHEAMLHCDGKNGIIVQELEKGYLMKGKVIRPAKVSVGNGN